MHCAILSLYIYISIVHVSFSLMINRLDLHLEDAEVHKVIKCSALSGNVVYRCITQVFC